MDASSMTALNLSEHGWIWLALGGVAWLTAGATLGAFNLLTLRWNVAMLASGRSLLLALALQLARFALIAAMLGVIAVHFGALPLLVATLGVHVSRAAVVRLGGFA
jgi:N-ATPase, AtpR subunit